MAHTDFRIPPELLAEISLKPGSINIVERPRCAGKSIRQQVVSDMMDAMAYGTCAVNVDSSGEANVLTMDKLLEAKALMERYSVRAWQDHQDWLREYVQPKWEMFYKDNPWLKKGDDKMMNQVTEFHDKFEVPTLDVPGFLDKDTMQFRINFLQEELDEIKKAYKAGNLEDFLDGLVDLVWVALGTAHVCCLPFAQAFDEVYQANMRKVKAETALSSKRGFGGDIVKPEDWQGPNIKRILARATAEATKRRDQRMRKAASDTMREVGGIDPRGLLRNYI